MPTAFATNNNTNTRLPHCCLPASREQDSSGVRDDNGNDDNSTWEFNTIAVFAFLALLIVCHILLLSCVEATWLSQV